MTLQGIARRLRSIPGKIEQRVAPLFFALPEVGLEALAGEACGCAIEDPILEHVCLPPYAGPDDHDDFTALMSIARARQPRIIVEFGTAFGNLTANLCRQCPDSIVYTINAPAENQTGRMVTYSLAAGEIGSVYRRLGFGSRVTQILKDSRDVDLKDYLPGPVVDLAIIDACHDTQYVINDFLKIRPFVRPGGAVLLHDTHPSMKDHLHGSYVACMRLRRRGLQVAHLRDTWWGVWINGSPDSVAEATRAAQPC